MLVKQTEAWPPVFPAWFVARSVEHLPRRAAEKIWFHREVSSRVRAITPRDDVIIDLTLSLYLEPGYPTRNEMGCQLSSSRFLSIGAMDDISPDACLAIQGITKEIQQHPCSGICPSGWSAVGVPLGDGRGRREGG